MARTGRINHIKFTGVWIRKWAQSIGLPNTGMIEYIHKILKYYPKNQHAIKSITQLNNELGSVDLKRLYSRVVHKYKKDLLIHLSANLSSKKYSADFMSGKAKSLILSQDIISGNPIEGSHYLLK